MKNFKKGFDPNDIIEYAKALELDNSDDIYIWFIGMEHPLAFGRSATCLNSYFPEMNVCLPASIESVGVEFVTVPVHELLDKFSHYCQRLDDHCLCIQNVKLYYMP